MKKGFFLLVCASFSACLSFAQAKFENWPQMKKFQSTLTETFKPAEKGDMTPIRSRSHELYQNAKLVNKMPVPQAVDNDQLRSTLKKLERETDKLNALVVREEQTPTVMKQFNIVHDTFHEITGMCTKEEK